MRGRGESPPGRRLQALRRRARAQASRTPLRESDQPRLRVRVVGRWVRPLATTWARSLSQCGGRRVRYAASGARSVSSVSRRWRSTVGALLAAAARLNFQPPLTSATDVVARNADDLARPVCASASFCPSRILWVRQSAGIVRPARRIPRRWMIRRGSSLRRAAVSPTRRADYLKGTVTGPDTLEKTAMKSRSSGVR